MTTDALAAVELVKALASVSVPFVLVWAAHRLQRRQKSFEAVMGEKARHYAAISPLLNVIFSYRFRVGDFLDRAPETVLGAAGVCPVVKKIWTPSWVLFSGGWCFLMLAAFHAATDAVGYGGWSYPLRVIGANSILIYVVAHLPIEHFILDSFRTHFGPDVFAVFGEPWEGVVAGATVLVVYWLGLWWLYTRRVFVRV